MFEHFDLKPAAPEKPEYTFEELKRLHYKANPAEKAVILARMEKMASTVEQLKQVKDRIELPETELGRIVSDRIKELEGNAAL